VGCTERGYVFLACGRVRRRAEGYAAFVALVADGEDVGILSLHVGQLLSPFTMRMFRHAYLSSQFSPAPGALVVAHAAGLSLGSPLGTLLDAEQHLALHDEVRKLEQDRVSDRCEAALGAATHD
jgi:hypothetical protein